ESFAVKVCGVKSTDDVEMVAASAREFAAQTSAVAVGINLYPPSKRYVNQETAAELAAAARASQLTVVAVTVDHDLSTLEDMASAGTYDIVQLHGNEAPSTAQRLMEHNQRVLRAVRLPIGEISVEQIDAAVSPWMAVGCGILLDAQVAGFGGAGESLDWNTIGHWAQQRRIPFVLAGGLNDQNAEDAIRHSGASAIDAASGTEQPKGRKSLVRIKRFVQIGLAQTSRN
ncbi:MAG: phosphoribosylanthranilate isomerase, partial [Planctomycetota bacterium]